MVEVVAEAGTVTAAVAVGGAGFGGARVGIADSSSAMLGVLVRLGWRGMTIRRGRRGRRRDLRRCGKRVLGLRSR